MPSLRTRSGRAAASISTCATPSAASAIPASSRRVSRHGAHTAVENWTRVARRPIGSPRSAAVSRSWPREPRERSLPALLRHTTPNEVAAASTATSTITPAFMPHDSTRPASRIPGGPAEGAASWRGTAARRGHSGPAGVQRPGGERRAHAVPANWTPLAAALTRTPPGVTPTDVTDRCRGSPVTGMRKPKWLATRLTGRLKPPPAVKWRGVTTIPDLFTEDAATTDTGTLTPREVTVPDSFRSLPSGLTWTPAGTRLCTAEYGMVPLADT